MAEFDGEPTHDGILQSKLATFLKIRTPPKTFCPSEVARALTSEELSLLGFETWRDAMPAIRELAWQWRADGECEVLQKGDTLGSDVALSDVRGPIRIRRTER